MEHDVVKQKIIITTEKIKTINKLNIIPNKKLIHN